MEDGIPATGQRMISRALSGFVLGGLRNPDDVEARRRFATINVISAIGILNTVPLGFVAWIQGKPTLGVFDHVVAIFLAANLLFLRRTGRYFAAAGAGLTVVAGLFIYLLVTGGVRGTGHLWFYTFPLISCFLLGARGGAVSSLAMLLIGVLHLALGGGRFPWVHVYEGEFLIRFIPSFLVVLAYSYLFERFRAESHRVLIRRNEQLAEAQGELEHKVDERTAALDLADLELRQSHARFATVLDSIDANVYAADLETHEILFANRRMASLFGDDLVGTQCFRSLRGLTEPCAGCTNPRLLDGSGRPTGVVTWEGRNQRNGNWFLHHDRAVEWVDGRYVRLQIATDLTSRKEAEEENARLQGQLAQAQKMEAIGTLAGGVAHDLNNVLTAVLGYPDLILRSLPEGSPLQSPLATIRDSAEKCSRIVSDLLTLARSGVTKRSPVSLSDVVGRYVESPEFRTLRALNPDVRFTCRLDADLRHFPGSEVHVFKTVLNLVTNAFEAMPGGGHLFVETAIRRLTHAVDGFTTIPAGDYAVLTVSDTGVGISEADLGRIFEPFFTRKVMGRSGTGLGMAVVWGAVVDHRGFIDIRSRPGAGAEFTVYFPLPCQALPTATAEEDAVPTGAGESILVVDDAEVQRDLAREILEQLGYRVETVPSGEMAVESVRGEAPDLVMLDMIMDPGIDGLETYRRILEIRPEQKAIIFSGYSRTDRVAEAQRLGVGAYLKKPYLVHELAMSVRRELDRGERDAAGVIAESAHAGG